VPQKEHVFKKEMSTRTQTSSLSASPGGIHARQSKILAVLRYFECIRHVCVTSSTH
jgi:hypothetical protein